MLNYMVGTPIFDMFSSIDISPASGNSSHACCSAGLNIPPVIANVEAVTW
jgi:hypothetical protein